MASKSQQRDSVLRNIVEEWLSSIVPESKDAFILASLAHWFNFELLHKTASIPEQDIMSIYLEMKGIPFVESYSDWGYSIHEVMRDALLKYLWNSDKKLYVDYSSRLADYFSLRKAPEDQIEYIYHLLIADPAGAERLLIEKLDTWSTPPDQNYDLASSLIRVISEHTRADRIDSAIACWGYYFEGLLAYRINESSRATYLFNEALEKPKIAEILRARLVCARGDAYRVLWKIKEAREDYVEAFKLFQHLGDRSGEANALRGLAHIFRATSDFEQARTNYEQARSAYKVADDPRGEATILRALGHIYRERGEYELAIDQYQKSLILCQELSDFFEQTNVLYRLGDVHRLMDLSSQAVLYFEQSIALCQQIGDKQHLAHSQLGLGLLMCEEGELDEAFRRLIDAKEIFVKLEHSRGRAHTLLALGKLQLQKNSYGLARQYYQDSLDIYRSTSSKKGEADALYGLSLTAWYTADDPKSEEFARQAALLYEGFDGPANLGHASLSNYLAHENNKAVKLAEQAFRLRIAPDMVEVKFTQAHALLQLGSIDEAMSCYKVAIDLCKLNKYMVRASNHLTELARRGSKITGLLDVLRLLDEGGKRNWGNINF